MRGVKGSGKAKAKANGKVAGTPPKNPKWAKAAVDADEDGADAASAGSAFPDARSGEAAVCRQDGTVLEAGRCPACARRAQRFAKLVELERAQNVCASCGAPATRKVGGVRGTPGPRERACDPCAALLKRERKLRAELKKG